MYVGLLDYGEKFTYTYAGSNIVPTPTSEENGVITWSWKTLYKTAIDLTAQLGRECFVGAVSVKLSESSVIAAEVLVDGDKWYIIRRRQTPEEIVTGECLPGEC